MLTKAGVRAHSFVVVLVATVFLAACTTHPPRITVAPSPSTASASRAATATATTTAIPEPRVTDMADIQRGIQITLDLFAQAYTDNNPILLQQAVDPTNHPFRRFVETRFNNDQQSFWGGQIQLTFTVLSLSKRDHGFVLARIETDGGFVSDWLFREVEDRWVLSEPTVAQIGAPRKIEREHFTFITYPWAQEINDKLITLMERARERVIRRLGQAPLEKPIVDLRPIYGLNPFENPFNGAYYTPSRTSKEPDTIDIFTPHGFNVGFL